MQRSKRIRSFLICITQVNSNTRIAVHNIKSGHISYVHPLSDAWAHIEQTDIETTGIDKTGIETTGRAKTSAEKEHDPDQGFEL